MATIACIFRRFATNLKHPKSLGKLDSNNAVLSVYKIDEYMKHRLESVEMFVDAYIEHVKAEYAFARSSEGKVFIPIRGVRRDQRVRCVLYRNQKGLVGDLCQVKPYELHCTAVPSCFRLESFAEYFRNVELDERKSSIRIGTVNESG